MACEINSLIINSLGIGNYISNDCFSEEEYNSEVTIGYTIPYQHEKFVSLLMYVNESSYTLFDDTLKNYSKPFYSQFATNTLLSYGIVDINQIFSSATWKKFKTNFNISKADSFHAYYFYIDNFNTVVLKLSTMHYYDPPLEIPIKDFVDYLKKDHPFTNYLYAISSN